jgi:hypothetical protein
MNPLKKQKTKQTNQWPATMIGDLDIRDFAEDGTFVFCRPCDKRVKCRYPFTVETWRKHVHTEMHQRHGRNGPKPAGKTQCIQMFLTSHGTPETASASRDRDFSRVQKQVVKQCRGLIECHKDPHKQALVRLYTSGYGDLADLHAVIRQDQCGIFSLTCTKEVSTHGKLAAWSIVLESKSSEKPIRKSLPHGQDPKRNSHLE